MIRLFLLTTTVWTTSFVVGCGGNTTNQDDDNAAMQQSQQGEATAKDYEMAAKKFEEEQASKKEEKEAAERQVTAESLGMEFKPIQPGTFTMGEGDKAREVTLSKAFEMGVHEVTQEQYEKIMGKNPSFYKRFQHPVERVSISDASNFCRKLSELHAEKAAGHVYRLPTEAEWEYACRAGSTTAFCFGDDESELGEYGWYKKNAGGDSHHPVGQKKPNAWGLYDMHGNVSERCLEDFGVPLNNHVNRGGHMANSAKGCTSSSLLKYPHTTHQAGFRVVRVAADKSKE